MYIYVTVSQDVYIYVTVSQDVYIYVTVSQDVYIYVTVSQDVKASREVKCTPEAANSSSLRKQRYSRRLP